jgi:uncharacterized protein (UPF0147 family)
MSAVLSNISIEQNYFANVAKAARELVKAVLGQPAQSVAYSAQSTISYLRGLANSYEPVMPELARELRYMAARVN